MLEVLAILKPALLFSLQTVSSVVHLCTRCSCSTFSLLGCALRLRVKERERVMCKVVLLKHYSHCGHAALECEVSSIMVLA